jgi:hypothetical protein
MTRRVSPEPMLPLDCRQRKPGQREHNRTYSAIQYLRYIGHAVYRQGSQHQIDGMTADSRQLIAVAASLGWMP